MNRLWRKLIVVGIVLSGIGILVSNVVWIPDIFTKKEHALSHLALGQNESISVTQQWNGFDMYSTYLHWRKSDGGAAGYVLDGDDIKRWRAPFRVDPQSGVVEVLFSGTAMATVYPKEMKVINRHRVEMEPLGGR